MSNFKHFIRKAAPIALTVIGSASTIAAVIFAAKEGPLYEKELAAKEEASFLEKAGTAVKVFGPAIGCAAVSVACGVGAHMMDMSTQASLMGACTAVKQGYNKLLKENAKVNGEEANKKLFEKAGQQMYPDLLKDGEGEKVYTVKLANLSEDNQTISFQSTKEDILLKMIRVNMELGKEGYITLNRLLEIFELDDYLTATGDDEGWSVDMLVEWNEFDCFVPWLVFDYITNTDGTITLYPLFQAYQGFKSDWGLDW